MCMPGQGMFQHIAPEWSYFVGLFEPKSIDSVFPRWRDNLLSISHSLIVQALRKVCSEFPQISARYLGEGRVLRTKGLHLTA